MSTGRCLVPALIIARKLENVIRNGSASRWPVSWTTCYIDFLFARQSEGVARPLQGLFRDVVAVISIVGIKIYHDVLSLLG